MTDKKATAKRDLTRGGILNSLLRLALPIMGTQLMQMAYNLTDMFWLGRVGSDAVASSGTAGLFIWLSVGLMLIGKVGAEIGVAQSRGRGDTDTARCYARRALYIAAVLGIKYGLFIGLLRTPLVGLFNFQETNVAADTALYLGIMSFGIPFSFTAAAIGGTFNASGNSKTPFIINTCGLVINMVLDPLFIFTFGLGVGGAAFASILAQAAVTVVMFIAVKHFKSRPFDTFPLLTGLKQYLSPKRLIKELTEGLSGKIFKWTLPIFLESSLFCFLTMITSRFEVAFGAYAIAMSRVGSQVESLTWLVGAGFGSALTAFVGQNFGAGKTDRIKQGVRVSAFFMTGWGLMVTALLALGGGVVFAVFLPDPSLRSMGITYLRILAFCQLPMNWEAVAANAFKGTGRTLPPSLTSIASNVIRVPLAFMLSKTSLGLIGIWVAVSITAGLRGIIICLWYYITERKNQR